MIWLSRRVRSTLVSFGMVAAFALGRANNFAMREYIRCSEWSQVPRLLREHLRDRRDPHAVRGDIQFQVPDHLILVQQGLRLLAVVLIGEKRVGHQRLLQAGGILRDDHDRQVVAPSGALDGRVDLLERQLLQRVAHVGGELADAVPRPSRARSRAAGPAAPSSRRRSSSGSRASSRTRPASARCRSACCSS